MLVKEVEEIGGQLIDRHYGEWMNIWTELSVPEGKEEVMIIWFLIMLKLVKWVPNSKIDSMSDAMYHFNFGSQKPRSCFTTYCSSIPRSQS